VIRSDFRRLGKGSMTTEPGETSGGISSGLRRDFRWIFRKILYVNNSCNISLIY
jgi:hypothetical protein